MIILVLANAVKGTLARAHSAWHHKTQTMCLSGAWRITFHMIRAVHMLQAWDSQAVPHAAATTIVVVRNSVFHVFSNFWLMDWAKLDSQLELTTNILKNRKPIRPNNFHKLSINCLCCGSCFPQMAGCCDDHVDCSGTPGEPQVCMEQQLAMFGGSSSC